MQAADWLAKLDRGDLNDEERTQFSEWLAENPENKEDIRQVTHMWYGLNEPLSRLAAVDGVEKAGQIAVALFAPALARLRGVAIVVCLLIVAALVTGSYLSSPPVTVDNYYATAIGETKVVALDDGSEVHLNTNTIVEQSYSHEQRIIRLISGEAIFDVAHDAERPFIVYAADGVIRAVGTRFAVRVAQNNVQVTVTEGRVALARRSDASESDNNSLEQVVAPVLVSKGETADISRVETSVQQEVSEMDMIERLSWSTGQLVFYDEDLQSVVDEVARYTTVQIKVMDESLKGKKITGILQIGDVDLMLEGVEGALNLETKRITPGLVHLTGS